MAKLIDGKLIAREILSSLKSDIANRCGLRPTLNILCVGDRCQSNTYVRLKQKAGESVGIYVKVARLSDECCESDLLSLLDEWNSSSSVDGIVVQAPLPAHIDSTSVFNRISADKDVDGLKDLSFQTAKYAVSATALATLRCIEFTGLTDFGNATVSVVGQGRVAGLPIYRLLKSKGFKEVWAVSKQSPSLSQTLLRSNVIVSAVGSPKLIRREHCSPGCIVVDVGCSKATNSNQLVGDVDFENVKKVAGWISPVPGGVGPVTVAMLLTNTFRAATNS